MTGSSISFVRITAADALRPLLLTDPIQHAYQLGDLDEPYWSECSWYGAAESEDLVTLVMVYRGLSMPVMLTAGRGAHIRGVLQTFEHELPGRAIIHCGVDHLEPVDRQFTCENVRPMVRMGLEAKNFSPYDASNIRVEDPWELVQLGHRDTGEMFDLYRFYPDSFFEPAQLGTGHYYGIRVEGQLVSVAGVHVFSPHIGVACLGNVVTHPDWRGNGLSKACTSHLCGRLIERGINLLALNVAGSNTAAIHVYRKLGFDQHNTYLEGMVTKPLGPLSDSSL